LPSRFQIWLDGAPVAGDFYDRITSLEVEENADMPGSLQLKVPVARSEDGDLTMVNDAGLQPFKNIAVVVTPQEGEPGCIFDGFILGHKLHMESGLRSSWLEVYAHDASWLMNLEEKTREWANTTDATTASAIFGEYGISPAPENSDEDSGAYTEDTHTLMQRGTDFEFLRTLARRAGRFLRVTCGPVPGARIGVFARPNVQNEPKATLRPNDTEAPNISQMDFEWDVMRPTSVTARQALFTDPSESGASGDSTSSGLDLLDERSLETFASRPMQVMLTAPADDVGQLQRRSQALLREAQWFAKCTGEADLGAVHKLLRAGDIARVETAGSVHSGKYLVWSVRHTIGLESHKMAFQLVRNAAGPEPSGGGGLLGGLL
jgi:phage protein D